MKRVTIISLLDFARLSRQIGCQCESETDRVRPGDRDAGGRGDLNRAQRITYSTGSSVVENFSLTHLSIDQV